MTYCCKECSFLFQRVGEIQVCPFCEGYRIRPATAEEAEQLQDRLNKTTRKHIREETA